MSRWFVALLFRSPSRIPRLQNSDVAYFNRTLILDITSVAFSWSSARGVRVEKSLSCNLTPFPIQYWFNTTDYPQIAADAFGCGISVFSKTSINGKPLKTSSFFAPLTSEPTNCTIINILLDHNHFYLIETTRTKTGRPVKFSIPTLNPYHKALFKRNPTLCVRDYSIIF